MAIDHVIGMAKRKRSAQSSPGPVTPSDSQEVFNQSIITSDSLSLHALFQQRVATMLERTDLSEEQKQEVLVAMACPCCGAGAMSYTVKLR